MGQLKPIENTMKDCDIMQIETLFGVNILQITDTKPENIIQIQHRTPKLPNLQKQYQLKTNPWLKIANMCLKISNTCFKITNVCIQIKNECYTKINPLCVNAYGAVKRGEHLTVALTANVIERARVPYQRVVGLSQGTWNLIFIRSTQHITQKLRNMK